MITPTRQYSPSGNLDRSISYAVRKVNKLDAITLRVFLDPTYTTNNGIDYGKIQHDGMGSGFKLSPASPRRGTTGRNNLEHDWFLYNAFMRDVPKLKRELEKAPARAARKVGLA